MAQSEALTQEALNNRLDPDPEWEEEWEVLVSSSKEPYTLGKKQARLLQEAIAAGSRGIVMFQTFAISIPYITEFYRKRRFLKEVRQLPQRATEPPYEPISAERWNEIKQKLIRNGVLKPKAKEGENG